MANFGKHYVILREAVGTERYAELSNAIKEAEELALHEGKAFYIYESIRVTQIAPRIAVTNNIDLSSKDIT